MLNPLNRLKNITGKSKNAFHEQVIGSLIGFTVGDALGVPLEFQSRQEAQGVSDMRGYGTHGQPKGSWSDDSSLTFCLVENLIEGYDIEKLKNSFCEWYYYGYWTHDGKLPFDIGQSTFKALSKIKAGISKGETGESSEKSNGNGSLMRVMPLSFYLKHTLSPNDKFPFIEEVSGITHAHIRSKIACSFYVEFAIQLLHDIQPKEAYQKTVRIITDYYTQQGFADELIYFERILQQDISLLEKEDIESSGYVIHSLEATLWCFLNHSTYREVVLSAIQLGGDTDTIGALAGGLAGMYYGYSTIPSKWVRKIARKNDIVDLSNRFYFSLKERTKC
ncbi:hypothetical protein CVD28_00420 [Bacillus sp. M6-12]|nr:hypothetical protein CVD28_00420 [Bacillus sp. M6-12]